ncbi:hypothetical protein [Ensifer sp. YR511]|uniref:beta strand repeat-containing protein n=1 Tax=Ensifer sp. YR511 TaxID=1855294 RepID=UPI0008827B8C|nr:hypothetical protein [Ensifer sp. YR511]SDN39118.1 hypothetical protein SAMN05216328_12548 [Ensifer sp. YR511]
MAAEFSLTQEQRDQLNKLTDRGTRNFADGYDYLRSLIEADPDADNYQEQHFWLGKAAEINRNDLTSEANVFIRAITRAGLLWDQKAAGPAKIQETSDLIGRTVLKDVIDNGKLPLVDRIIAQDALAAIRDGGQTMAGWGGAFNYWDIQLSSNPGDTVGNRIMADPAEYEKFLAVAALATVDVMQKFGMSLQQAEVALRAQLPNKALSDVLGRVDEALTKGFGFAGDPSLIDGYSPVFNDAEQLVGWRGRNSAGLFDLTDSAKIHELNQRLQTRLDKMSDPSWELSATDGNLGLDGSLSHADLGARSSPIGNLADSWLGSTAAGLSALFDATVKGLAERNQGAELPGEPLSGRPRQNQSIDMPGSMDLTPINATERLTWPGFSRNPALDNQPATYSGFGNHGSSPAPSLPNVSTPEEIGSLPGISSPMDSIPGVSAPSAWTDASYPAHIAPVSPFSGVVSPSTIERIATPLSVAPSDISPVNPPEMPQPRPGGVRPDNTTGSPLTGGSGGLGGGGSRGEDRNDRASNGYGAGNYDRGSSGESNSRGSGNAGGSSSGGSSSAGSGRSPSGGYARTPSEGPTPSARPDRGNSPGDTAKGNGFGGGGSYRGNGPGRSPTGRSGAKGGERAPRGQNNSTSSRDLTSPVLLDLTGNGLDINALTSSSRFIETSGDGYARRSAWAAEGNGVLVLDLGNDGKITDEKEFAFAEWDPGASGDLAALKSAFDTNGNGKLDAGDARWGEFKVMVGDNLASLASLGIESIDLTPTGAGRVFSDGSEITGTTTFTRTDCSKGAVGDAVLAMETTGYVIKRATTSNEDGSTTTEIFAYSKAGTLAFRELVTVSHDKTTTTTRFDDDGNGTYDRLQTVVLSIGADGSRTRVVSNFAVDGALTDRTTTTTSANKSNLTTLVDANGDGIVDERQMFAFNAGGSTSTTIEALSASGAILKRVVIESTADGLTKTTRTDRTGRGVFDVVRMEMTTVGADGSRTKTITETSANGALLSKIVQSISANGKVQSIDLDNGGSGRFDERRSVTTEVAADGAVSTTSTVSNADGSLREKTVAITGANGRETNLSSDLTGDGLFDEFTSTKTTIGGDGTWTETTERRSGDGSLLARRVSTNNAYRSTTTIEDDKNGDGYTDEVATIVAGPDRSTTTTIKTLNRDGTAIATTAGTVSVDGLTQTVKRDLDGDGVFDEVTTDTTVTNADGSRTQTIARTSASAALLGKVIKSVSANSLTRITETDIDVNGSIDLTVTDVSALGADGRRVQTVSARSSNGTLLSSSETTISADRKMLEVLEDTDGDGKRDRHRTAVVGADGSRTETVVSFAADGSKIQRRMTTVSADGLTTTVEIDADGNGAVDTRTTDATVINADGSRTRTLTARSSDNTLLSTSTVKASSNGLTSETRLDRNGDGTTDHYGTDYTFLNQDGSRTRIVSVPGESASKTIVSANGLTKFIEVDANSDGHFERTSRENTELHADGSVSTTDYVTSATGKLLAKTTSTTSANRNSTTKLTDRDGDGINDFGESASIDATGVTTTTASTYALTGGQAVLNSRTVTMVSANGLISRQTLDIDGNGTIDKTTETAKTLRADGSVSETFAELNGAGSRTAHVIKDVSANGLAKTTRWMADGVNLSRKATETRLLNADGSILDTVSTSKGNGTLESKVTVSVSADKRTATTSSDIDGDGIVDQTVQSTILLNGLSVTTSKDLAADGIQTSAARTVTKSADGLVTTTTYDGNGDGTVDSKFEMVKTLQANGTQSETVTRFGANGTAAERAVIDTSAGDFSISRRWDLNADGTFERSETDVTTLSFDGAKTRTVSTLLGSTLQKLYQEWSNANRLSKTRQWDLDGNGTYEQAATDRVFLNLDGTSLRMIESRRDGVLFSSHYTTTSADGRTVSINDTREGFGLRMITSTVNALADDTTIETRSVRDASNRLTERQTTTTFGNGRDMKIERDADGDGDIDQVETRSKAVDGASKTVITDFNAGGSKAGVTIISVAADGRTTTTEWDQDGNSSVDRRRVLTESFNADGSYEGIAVDTKVAGNTVAARTNTNSSADGRTRSITRDLNGDGAIDVNEVSISDVSGTTIVTTTNNAEARSTKYLREGDVYWSEAIAAKTELTLARDGLFRTMRSDYDGDGTFEHVATSQTQIDGSIVTRIEERNAGGTVIAKGISTVTADGMITTLKKDANNDGKDDRFETSVLRIDGSLTNTSIENNADGTVKQTTRTEINALGVPTLVLATDAQSRKILEHIFRPDGSSTRTAFAGASGNILWKGEFGTNGVQTGGVLFDPLNQNTWSRVEQFFDAAGAKTLEKQFNDNGTTQEHRFNPATGKLSDVQTFAANGALTSKTLFDAQGKATSSVLYDPLNQQSWSRAEQTFDTAGVKTLEKQFNDDGTRTEFFYWSPSGAVSESHNFSVNGSLLSKTFFDAAGKRTSAIAYDPLNQNGWSHIEQTYDASDVKTLEKQFNDNGTRVDVFYRSPGGKPYESQNFGADGHLDSKTVYDTTGVRTSAVVYDPRNQASWSRVEQTFDAAQVKTVEKQFGDDGTRAEFFYRSPSGVVYEVQNYATNGSLLSKSFYDTSGKKTSAVVYDPSNQNAWSRVEQTFDTAGVKTLEKQFQDNGTRTDLYYRSPGGQLYEAQVFSVTGVLTSKTEYDALAHQVWSRREHLIDAQGRITQSVTFNDDGSRRVESFDAANAQSWSTSRSYHNAVGQLYYVDQANDNGTFNTITYDVANTQGWSRYEQYKDNMGRVLVQSNFNDNGTRSTYSYDPTNAQTWSLHQQNYNAAGQLHTVDQTNDDGTHNTIQYDVDNNQGWSRYEQYIDNSGRLVNQANYNDDGTRHVYSFDPANTQSWMKITQVYNAVGALAWQANEFDNGTTETTTFNVYNNQPWSKFVEVKNAAGTVTTTAAYQSDNSRFVKFWDASNSQPWSYLEQYVNAAGQVTAQFQRRDDGVVEESRYDGQPTARQLATFDAEYYMAANPDVAAGWNAPAIDHFSQFGWKEGRRPNAWFDSSFYLQQYADIRNGGLNPFEHWRGWGYAEGRKPYAGYTGFEARATGDLAGIQEPLFTTLQWNRIGAMRTYAKDTYRRITSDNDHSRPRYGPGVMNTLQGVAYTYDDRRVLSLYPSYVQNRFGVSSNKPVMLDLDGDDHIDLRIFSPAVFEAGNGPRFDWDGDGIADGSAWAGPADGWLAIDVAADGSAGPDGLINQAKELAFTMWKTPEELAGEQADITDLEALRLVFDTNHNNQLDAGDARWNEFRVWRDANQNGVTDAGELRTLEQADIRLIELVPSSAGARQLADGSAITGTSSYLKGDGSRALVGDATITFRPGQPTTAVA